MVSIAGVDMFTNEAIAAFAPSPLIETQYLYWAAPILVPRNARENIYGAPLLNRDRIANARLLSPPTPEQRAIAAFLDRGTARIDSLIAKVRDAIDRLEELRTALISAGVTGKIDGSEGGRRKDERPDPKNTRVRRQSPSSVLVPAEVN